MTQWTPVEFLNRYRSSLMGLAIILIILYHSNAGGMPIYYPFSNLFIGVDIFLLLGGLGLCYSYNKNGLRTFWINRFLRIMPVFMLFVLLYMPLQTLAGSNYVARDYLSMWSTLAYYGIGNLESDWYISVYVLLCLVFPLLYYMIARYGARFVIGIVVADIVLMVWLKYHFEYYNWQYQCGLGRIPVICLGIYLYSNPRLFLNRILLTVYVAAVLAVFFFINRYLGTALLTPPLLYCLEKYNRYVFTDRIVACLSYIGRYTLELYLGNTLAMTTLRCIDFPDAGAGQWLLTLPAYLVLNVAYAAILAVLNKYTVSLLRRILKLS